MESQTTTIITQAEEIETPQVEHGKEEDEQQ
jgi:hypothetical protein